MYSMFGSTIAAISTPRGKGGVAVIRISGEEAFSICENFVFPKSKKNRRNYAELSRRGGAYCRCQSL
jgi:tRNA modification GTPase